MQLSENQTKTLMVSAQAGDEAAYKQLLEQLYSFLTQYLKKKVFNKNEIEEVAQEILLAVHKARHTYDADKHFMGWFMAITDYKVIDYIRAKKRNPKYTELDEVEDNIKHAFALDTTYDFEKAFARLSDKERNVLRLMRIEGYQLRETALKLGLSESNVKVIAHRAYRSVQEFLEVKIENK